MAEHSGLVGLAARLVRQRAESEVWDEARRHVVKRILEGRTQAEEMKELPPALMEKLLLPKGYMLPGTEVQQLGSGSFGRVLKVRRNKDGRLLALKRQPLGDEARDVVPVLRETSILNVLKGACNVVQIEDAFLSRPFGGGPEVWTVLEFFPHNLDRVKHRFVAEESARRVIFQILLGLHSLHSADIIHRDLKPDNVLADLGPRPPETVRVAICDFGMSRSVHGFEEAIERVDAGPMTPLARCRKLSDRVTSCWWRAPEMWGWADTKHMTKRDLKSLDVFALGLVWAGLLTRRSVITHEEGVDPPKFRLLEILRKVDRPTDVDLSQLGLSADVARFVRHVLRDDLAAVRAEMVSAEWPRNHELREKILQGPYTGIREWVRGHAAGRQDLSASPALSLIEASTRFSYRARPAALDMLGDPYFFDLRQDTPPRHWAHREAPQFADVREALEEEQRRQLCAARRTQELRALRRDGGKSGGPDSSDGSDIDSDSGSSEGALAAEDVFMHRMATRAAEAVEQSVRVVCDRVRAELVHSQRH